MLFLLISFIVLVVAGLAGWTADSREYANWPRNGDALNLRPRT